MWGWRACKQTFSTRSLQSVSSPLLLPWWPMTTSVSTSSSVKVVSPMLAAMAPLSSSHHSHPSPLPLPQRSRGCLWPDKHRSTWEKRKFPSFPTSSLTWESQLVAFPAQKGGKPHVVTGCCHTYFDQAALIAQCRWVWKFPGQHQIRHCPKFSSCWCNACEIVLATWKHYWDPKTLEHMFLPRGSTTGLRKVVWQFTYLWHVQGREQRTQCILRKLQCGSQRLWAPRGKWPP